MSDDKNKGSRSKGGTVRRGEVPSVAEAQDKLPDLLAQALAGDEVIITEHGMPLARLAPVVAHEKKKRVAGLNRGTISTSEDFDEPLPDQFWLGQE